MQTKIADGARQELARRHYADYVSYTHRGNYQHAKHTRLICERLEKLIYQTNQRIVIALPPRHSKSMTITETFPSFYLCKHPEKRVILAAYASTLADGFSRRNRQKIEEFGRTLFNLGLSKEKATENEWEMDNKIGGLISAGMLGGVTGKGADLLIIDDPIKNMAEALSETYRNKVWNEWEATFSTRLHPGANVILIMTMWHQDDLANRFIRKDWETIIIPCEAEVNDILGREVGEPLWPERGYDKAWIEAKKLEVGSRVWSALYQQKPVPSDGEIFKESWFRFYRRNEEIKVSNKIQSWDLAFEGKKTSDYVVGQVWGEKGVNAYLEYQWRDRASFMETVKAIRTVTNRFPEAKTKLVEKKANGAAVIDSLKDDITGIVDINPKESKIARANAITPFMEAGNVWFPHPDEQPWVNDLIAELLAFPNGANDDQVDALTQALHRIYLSKKKVKTRRGLF